ncbi:MAG: phosphate ABC transporter permease subunit PstC [Mycobacterium sp.]|nr:phosphate ABC transporter permease subunit PstC [Mycobacterium sp.]
MTSESEQKAAEPSYALRRLRGNTLLQLAATSAAAMTVGAIGLMALFLLISAVPSMAANNANFLTSGDFVTNDADGLRFGIAGLLQVTVLSSVFALVIAVPVALGVATFLTNFVPRPLARPLSMLVDLLAAIPSIVFGVWGIFVLAPQLEPLQSFLNENLSWFFLFADGNVPLAGGGTIFTAGVVLAVMIVPIIAAVTREAFSVTPRSHIEAAQALGGTKWEVVHMAVYPYGRSGLVAGAMLGLGRALGETVAVLIILRTAAQTGHWSLFDGGYTFASKIASAAAEFTAPRPAGAYIAAGFVLFALTFVANAIARMVVSRTLGAR